MSGGSPWWKWWRSTEGGDAPGSQGATTENIVQYSREEQRREAGGSADRMPAPLPPRAASYKASGVDIDAGNETVRRIKTLARSTFTPGVLSEIGSFGGLFSMAPGGWADPVLVASADGVGTKLKVAFLADRHDTIGQDLVNHCVNDILVQGATPLFFLDYLATGRLSPDVAEQIVRGLAIACRDNGCALLGGETAEMPGFYADGEYDVAGFIVGAVERARLVDGRSLVPGDVLLGLPSVGLHTNGYSLARQIAFARLGLRVDSHVADLGETVGQALLRPHVSYLKPMRPLLDAGVVKGMAHITGGGLTDNVPRILPDGTAAEIRRGAWPELPIFRWLVQAGDVALDDQYRAFNMGVGLVVAVAAADVPRAHALLAERGQDVHDIGRIVAGTPGVRYV
jgi:phosphoribosylformylglycinamidine cyclo-ligase